MKIYFKKVFIIFAFCSFYFSSAQTYYEKKNPLNGNVEYYNKESGIMVAYKSYNSLTGSWETTILSEDKNKGGTYIENKERVDENFDMLYRVMSNKQRKYENNFQLIQDHVKKIYQSTNKSFNINNSNSEKEVVYYINDLFYKKCVKQIKNTDLSSASALYSSINFLNKCYYDIKNHLYQEAKSAKGNNYSHSDKTSSLGYYTEIIKAYQPVKLYSETSTSSDVKIVLASESKVKVLIKNVDGKSTNWSKISYNGMTGYVLSHFLRSEKKILDNSTSKSKSVNNKTKTIKKSVIPVRLYSNPKSNSKVILELKTGELVSVINTVTEKKIWSYVNYEGKLGYVMTHYLE